MTTTFRQETARIYQFRGKAPAAAIQAYRAEGGSVTDLRSPRLAVVEFGSGWYHEAAVKDAERTAKPEH